MNKIYDIADKADVIIDGYAFIKNKDKIDVINLNKENHAAVFFKDESLIETSMDDIELSIAKDYLKNAKKYMELENA